MHNYVFVMLQLGGVICEKLKHPLTGLLKLALWGLSTWFGTLILCGMGCVSTKFPFIHSYPELSLQKRQEIMRSWSLSYIRLFRLLFRTIKLLTLLLFFTQVFLKKSNIYAICLFTYILLSFIFLMQSSTFLQLLCSLCLLVVSVK